MNMATGQIYNEMQMSAINEIANIGTGNAATALSQMTGISVDIDPPQASFVPLAEAVDRIGKPETPIIGVLTGVVGQVPANILLAFPFEAAISLCSLLGVDAMSDIGKSALQEIGNILTSSYLIAIGQMTGLEFEPEPPLLAVDMLGSIVDGVLAATIAASADDVLFLKTAIRIEDAYCDFGFLYVPTVEGVQTLLGALGVA